MKYAVTIKTVIDAACPTGAIHEALRRVDMDGATASAAPTPVNPVDEVDQFTVERDPQSGSFVARWKTDLRSDSSQGYKKYCNARDAAKKKLGGDWLYVGCHTYHRVKPAKPAAPTVNSFVTVSPRQGVWLSRGKTDGGDNFDLTFRLACNSFGGGEWAGSAPGVMHRNNGRN